MFLPPYKIVKALINAYSITHAVFWVIPHVEFHAYLECIVMQWTSLRILANNGEGNVEVRLRV